jgi:hypothetical protein
LLLGYDAQAEVSVATGRIDVVVQLEAGINVMEFKVGGSAEAALAQVRERKYYEKYLPFGKKIYLLGLVCADKGVKDWKLAQAWPTTP